MISKTELKVFRIAERWGRGETPTESEIDLVYNELPEIMQNYGSAVNCLANIADTDVSSQSLRHMAARTLGRPSDQQGS